MITQKRLKELFDYNPEKGEMIRKVITTNCVKTGEITGKANSHGYQRIQVDGVLYGLHRIVWRYFYGEIPTEIDHIDGNRSNNKIKNLRNVTHKENGKNLCISKANKSGVTGVHFSKRDGKWLANIMAGGKTIHLGVYKNKSDAIAARKEGEAKHGFHENHGRPACAELRG